MSHNTDSSVNETDVLSTTGGVPVEISIPPSVNETDVLSTTGGVDLEVSYI